MWKCIPTLFGVLSLLKSTTCAANCYSQYCQNTSLSMMESQWRNTQDDVPQCLLTAVQNNSDCMNIKFHGVRPLPPPGVPLADLKLSAYVYYEGGVKATAFNLTVKDVRFQRLITRYQERGDPALSYCRHIHFSGFDKVTTKPNLYISCPFAAAAFEERSYWLEYLITGDNYEYIRRLLFNVPSHHHIGDRVSDVKNYIPFIYADVSDIPILSLTIQKLPKRFSVSNYRIWVINNETGTSEIFNLNSLESEDHIKHNFSMSTGAHYIYVSAMHPNCGEYGCINSTLPVITIKPPTRRILIMIISVVWIPPVILYAFYYMWKLYKRKDLFKQIGRKPKCLLVYSPTHMAHVNVVSNLAKYLRACNIAAMVDVLDIQETVTKDPGHWCNEAFKSADTIIVLASPNLPSASVPIIYRNVDNHALRLLKENYSLRNKRYISIELPYCNPGEIPEEARLFKKFRLPENLEKLVKYIHNIDFIRCFSGSSQFLIESINVANLEISRERQESPKNINETDGLLTINEKSIEICVDKEVSEDPKPQECKDEQPGIKRNYKTKINELNLLGEREEPKEIRYRCPVDTNFRIDQLDL